MIDLKMHGENMKLFTLIDVICNSCLTLRTKSWDVKRWIFSGMRVEGTVLTHSIEKRTRKDEMETRTMGKFRKHEHHKEELVIFRKDWYGDALRMGAN